MSLVNPIVQKWIDEGKQDPEAFWGRAADQLPWFRKWDRVLDWTPPTFNWFVGAQTNLAYNALDYHVKRGWGGHTALIYFNERGELRVFTVMPSCFTKWNGWRRHCAAWASRKAIVSRSTCRPAPKPSS